MAIIAMHGGAIMLQASTSLKKRELHSDLYLQLLGSAAARNPEQPLQMMTKARMPMTPIHWLHSHVQTTPQHATLPLLLRAQVPSLLEVKVQDPQRCNARTEHMLNTCTQAFLNMMILKMMMIIVMMILSVKWHGSS